MKDFFYRVEGDRTHRANPSWYRGEACSYLPSKAALREPGALTRHIVAGWQPPEPFIGRETGVTAFGSCFAQHLSAFLRRRDYRVGNALLSATDLRSSHVVEFGAGIVNTHAIRQQLEWAFEGRRFAAPLWRGAADELAAYDEDVREATAEIFASTDVFVLTLGLSEVWFHRETGEAMWRAVPRARFDPALHGFRFASFAENLDNLRAIRALVQRHRPRASIVLTLSPIPLVASFRPISCVTANEASKATLRAAIDELMRTHADDAQLHYWPAYELVRYGFADPYRDDGRHLRREVLAAVLAEFEGCYLREATTREQLQARRRAHVDALAEALGVDRALAERIESAGWMAPGELARTWPAKLARALGCPKAEAEALVAAARSRPAAR